MAEQTLFGMRDSYCIVEKSTIIIIIIIIINIIITIIIIIINIIITIIITITISKKWPYRPHVCQLTNRSDFDFRQNQLEIAFR